MYSTAWLKANAMKTRTGSTKRNDAESALVPAAIASRGALPNRDARHSATRNTSIESPDDRDGGRHEERLQPAEDVDRGKGEIGDGGKAPRDRLPMGGSEPDEIERGPAQKQREVGAAGLFSVEPAFAA